MKRNISSLRNSLAVMMLSSAVLVGMFGHTVVAEERYTINLSANVPSDKFHVLPVDVGWISQPQEMHYNHITGKLNIFEKLFQFRNDSGAIQASLTGNLTAEGKPYLSNGKDIIPLVVSFNNKEISNSSDMVVPDTMAKAGGRTMLKISQAGNEKLAVSGSFTGNVDIIFEPALGSGSK